MTVWTRISDILQGFGETIGDFLSAIPGRAPAPEKSVAFTIGLIALGAKMAVADGAVTTDEVAAFKQVFQVPDKDQAALQRVFDLAKQDVAGYEVYAKQVARLFAKKAAILENVLDGLFHIAKADGIVHEAELSYLSQVAKIFGFEDTDFSRIRSRHVRYEDDPYEILGVRPGASLAEVKTRHRKLVRELHPDKQIAAGLPEELVQLATDRVARINAAFDQIMKGNKV